jgi:ParB family chromosome partitioning protein
MAKMSKELQSIPVDCILPNKNQPEKHSMMIHSANSQPPSVQWASFSRSVSNEYKMVPIPSSVEKRRLRAAKLAGLTHVPCVLIRAEEKDLDVMSLVENIQREDLNYVEEAKAYEKLIENTVSRKKTFPKK